MSVVIPKFLPKSAVKKGSWQPYLFLGLIANAAIWSLALLYLKLAPATYTSHSAIAVPGEGAATNVNLPNIGEATYQNSSPYAITTQDPRESYKFIAESEPVLKAAATQLNMPLKKFGKPRMKTIDNTPIMEVDFQGATPEEAHKKALIFYQVLEARLDKLRRQELIRRDVGSKTALNSSQKKVEVAQNRLSNYKALSGLDSSEQLRDLSINTEQLRRQQAEILAQQQQASTRLKQLSTNLNLSAQQAADAFILQTDQIFQQNLKDYSETSAALDVLSSKFLPNYPQLVAQKAARDAAQKALLKRSQSLLGRQVDRAILQQLSLSNISSGSPRERLFQELITVQADQKGLQVQAQALARQIAKLEDRHKKLAQQESTLDALSRDRQVAETVFSSTLTKLDLDKSNVFGSYPLLQIVTEPTLAEIPTWPNKGFVLIGTALCSFLIDAGIVLMWLNQRNALISKKVKSTRLEE